MPKKVGRGELEDHKLTIVMRVLGGSEEHALAAFQDNMDLDEERGEGILHYDLQKVS